MNADHGRFADWDAAYVLGSLTASDRRLFEGHLDTCTVCRQSVAELAPTAGLLSRLSMADAEQIDDGPDASTRAGLVSLVRERSRRRMRIAGIVAAVALVVALVAVPVTIAVVSRPTASFALEDVTGVPLEASVRLTEVSWGTRVELDCRYPADAASDAPEGGWVYTLVVVAADGTDDTVSTWRAAPGSSARLSAGSALAVADIRSVEIRTATGVVLMRHELDPPPVAAGRP